jgi:hypothetical protein
MVRKFSVIGGSDECALGSLEWNADLGWWSGSGDLAPGHQVDLHVQAPNENAELRSAVERAGPAWERFRASEPLVRAAVADQMVEAHNDYCEPEDEVTSEQFAAQFRLLSVLFEPTGGIELCYHDGLLFGGHRIIVPLSEDGQVGQACEAG